MSIALEAKVAVLELRVSELQSALALANAVIDSFGAQLADTAARCVELERTAQRKPGPKPKDASNG